MDATKRAEEIPQSRPDPLHRIAVHFSSPIPIVISGILPVRVTHRVMAPACVAHVVVRGGLVRINRCAATRCAFHFGLNGLLLRILTHR